jgi:hypothetical protein
VNRLPVLFALTAFTFNAFGQKLSATDAKLAATVRAHYYNLVANGFESMSCSVAFDLTTVPLLPPATDDPVRQLVERAKFTLAIDDKGRPTVQHSYPADATEAQKQAASQVTGLMTSFVNGLFLTWPSKGLQGPIPAFDSEIESAISTNSGYKFSLSSQEGTATVFLDKNFLVTEIVSGHDKIHEHPTYEPTPEGLVFVGNDASDESNPDSPVKIKYELDTTVINGLHVPASARLRVNDNVDTRFSLTGCVLKKATVIHIPPPA